MVLSADPKGPQSLVEKSDLEEIKIKEYRSRGVGVEIA